MDGPAQSSRRANEADIAPAEQLPSKGWQQAEEIRKVRQASGSVYARLRSIEFDARQVLELCERLTCDRDPLPLFGNLRAGGWYVPPSASIHPYKASYCSFKSADGHYGQWNVNIRRPNVVLLRAAVSAGGAFVVDATRSGKTWPDALSKTLPMWCGLMNALVGFPTASDGSRLVQIHSSIPQGEATAIDKLFPTWLEAWRASGIDLDELVPEFRTGAKPLRPLWIRSDSERDWETGLPTATELGFIPIVCVSAGLTFKSGTRAFVESGMGCDQRSVLGVSFPPRTTGHSYVRGAGDDEDSWSRGISPFVFWTCREELLRASSEEETPSLSRARGDRSVLETAIEEAVCRTGSLLRDPSSGPPDSTHSSADSTRGGPLLFKSGLRVIPSQPGTIQNEAVAAVKGGADSVVVLTHARFPEKDEARPDSDTLAEGDNRFPQIRYFNLANFRRKPDYKNGLCRVLGPCLDHLRSVLVHGSTATRNLPVVAILCDSGNGEWAAGLAIAWIVWHCDSSLDIVYGSPMQDVSKTQVRNVMLRVLSNRPDLTISRNAQQQLNRFFQSPRPPSTTSATEGYKPVTVTPCNAVVDRGGDTSS